MSSGYGGDHIELKSLSINDLLLLLFPRSWMIYWFGLKTVIFLLFFALFFYFLKNLHFKKNRNTKLSFFGVLPFSA